MTIDMDQSSDVNQAVDDGAKLRCACLMMQKNEGTLLLPWVLYHGHLFGFGALFVFDNGSTDPDALAALAQVQRLGVHVDRCHDQKLDFARKGEVLGHQMRALRDEGGWDILIPLDCDEFLALGEGEDDVLSFDPARIRAALAVVAQDDRVPYILNSYLNVLGTQDRFRPERCLKTFIQARAFLSIDHGFHQAISSLSDTPMDSGLVYIHCHAKPFARAVRDAREKLAFWCDVDSPLAVDRLEADKGPGWHLVSYLKMTEREYLARLEHHDTVELPGFAQKLAEVGADTGFLLGLAPPIPNVTLIVTGPACTVRAGNNPQRSGNGTMIFATPGPALDCFMRALSVAGITIGAKADLYLDRHWVAAFNSGEAESIRREMLVLGAQPSLWASWFPKPLLLTPDLVEALRYPRTIQLATPDHLDVNADAAGLAALDLPVLQIDWPTTAAGPARLAETVLAYLCLDPIPERIATMTEIFSQELAASIA